QFLCSRLHLLKEARVLDGDDGLVGEDAQQFNLSLGKWAHVGATQGNHTDGFPSTNKGDGQHGVVAKTPGDCTGFWILIHLRLRIGEVNRLPVDDGTPGGTSTRQGHSASPTDRGNVHALRNNTEHVTVLLPDRRVMGVAKGRR